MPNMAKHEPKVGIKTTLLKIDKEYNMAYGDHLTSSSQSSGVNIPNQKNNNA
jgi:hypothetical protein